MIQYPAFCLGLLTALIQFAQAADPLITEFMATNNSVLLDADGQASDWIEIYNPASVTADLSGWHLTDDPQQLAKWSFPAGTSIPAGGFLLVFASAKEPPPAGELHANFKLDGSGEYLALVRPDGVSVVHEFGPTFPLQREDVSYGLATAAAVFLVDENTPAAALVPKDNSLGSSWHNVGYIPDGKWKTGAASVGYENDSGYEGLFDIDVGDQMPGVNESSYLRIPFTLAGSPANFSILSLRLRYDDGFVAFLNGTRLAGRNDPATLLWDSGATAQNPDETAIVSESIDVSAFLSALKPGANVLAIHGLNNGISSSDFLNAPELWASNTTFQVDQPRYFTVPSPGAVNTPGLLGLVTDTNFSHKRGFYDVPFAVTITSQTPGVTIRFTTDGSPPKLSGQGTTYISPIPITKTTVLRAAAFKDGLLSTNIDTQTYVFLDDVLTQPASVPGYPQRIDDVENEIMTVDYEMDPNVVNDPAYAPLMRDAMTSIPSISLVMDKDEMFDIKSGVYFNGSGSSSGIERETSMEFIYPDDPGRSFAIHAGVSPHSHAYIKRSLRILFRSQYGDAKLRSDIFTGAPLNADSAADRFDRLVLRAGGNRCFSNYWNPDDSTYTRDEWIRASQIAMSGAGSRGHFAHLYINGLYFGLYNLVERPDHFFAATYGGGDEVDYFARNHGGTISGDSSRWDYLRGTLKDKNMANAANYAELQQYLDVDQFSDYLILNWFSGTADWPSNNWYATNRNSPPEPMRFWVWDAEDTWDDEGSSGPFDQPGGRGTDGAAVHEDFKASDGKYSTKDIPNLFNSVKANADFMMLFADRVYKHLFNDGALTPENCIERWDQLNAYIRDAIIGESARWGDARETLPGEIGVLRDRDTTWQTEVDRIRTESMPGNVTRMIAVLRAEGYYPSINPPSLNQYGGVVESGFNLILTNPNNQGTIYFTADGTDPRAPGGAIAAGAISYAGTIEINGNTRIMARVRSGTTWSAMADATFIIDSAPKLRVTEIMYDPMGGGDFEFIEVQNVGNENIDLTEIRFTNGITFAFAGSSISNLSPGEYLVVVKNIAAFESRYGMGLPVAGVFTGSLDNNGERIRIAYSLDQTILDFTYDNQWHPISNGEGFSLVKSDPFGSAPSWNEAAGWRPSGNSGGSPGADDSGIVPGSVLINELLANPSTPGAGWVEIVNRTADPIDVSGWYLADHESNLQKYQFPAGTVLAGGGFMVVPQSIGLAMSATGGELYLSSASEGQLTGYRASITYGASAPDVTYGSHSPSTGRIDFPALATATPGAENSAPLIPLVIINEIMFHPSSGEAEFVELYNRSTVEIDLSGWSFSDGIVFTFAPGSTIAAGGYVLIDAADFSPSAMDDGGECLTLINGDGIVVESVCYEGTAPWYQEAAGFGPSLARRDANSYGNDPNAWEPGTSGGTPGSSNRTLDITPPSIPQILAAEVINAAQINLSWQASIDPESAVLRYHIYRNGVEIGTSTSLVFNDLGAEASIPYGYQVSAENTDGTESARGEVVSKSIMEIRSARPSDASHIELVFSETLEAASATTTSNYSLSGISISSAALLGEGKTVSLTLAQPLVEGEVRELLVAAIVGTGGAELPPITRFDIALATRTATGLIALYEFDDGDGSLVRDSSGFGIPLNLTIGNPGSVTWIDGALSIGSNTIIASASAATKIHSQIGVSNSVTIEAWLKPATVGQSGPARIVTLSANTSLRNFTLGQELDAYEVNLRTTSTSDNGVPAVSTSPVGQAEDLTHLVYTRDTAGNVRIYVNGSLDITGTAAGNLSNWDANYSLALANELTLDRPWRGELHLVAIYSGALGAAQVRQNFLAGANPAPVAQNTYGNWAASEFSPADFAAVPPRTGPLDDYDHDGLQNLLEYALGGSPKNADADAITPRATKTDDRMELIYTCDLSRSGLLFDVQASTDLATDSWSSVGVLNEVIGVEANLETRRASVPTNAQRRFLRLRVTAPGE